MQLQQHHGHRSYPMRCTALSSRRCLPVSHTTTAAPARAPRQSSCSRPVEQLTSAAALGKEHASLSSLLGDGCESLDDHVADASATDAEVEIRLSSTAAANGQLPVVLVATFPEAFLSMSSARKACRRRTVQVDGSLGSCSTTVNRGQLLQVLAAPQQHPRFKQQQQQYQPGSSTRQQLTVKYIDEQLAVVVKPFGLHLYGRGTGHLKHWLSEAIPVSGAGDALPAACPVHRLDALTGGLVVCARTKTAARLLTQAFEQRLVRKQYRALLAGRCTHTGTIELPVKGKPAVSQVHVVQHTRSLKFGWVTTVDLLPLTGRTHQLRLHMSALGHPILGDPLYNQFIETARLSGRGMCLWAQKIVFPHPLDMACVVDVGTAEPERFAKVRQQEFQRYIKFNGTPAT